MKEIEVSLESDFYKQTRRAITDFYKTELVLYYPPHLIVLAAVKIASKHTGSKLEIGGGNTAWYKVFDEETTEDQIEGLVEKIYEYLSI